MPIFNFTDAFLIFRLRIILNYIGLGFIYGSDIRLLIV